MRLPSWLLHVHDDVIVLENSRWFCMVVEADLFSRNVLLVRRRGNGCVLMSLSVQRRCGVGYSRRGNYSTVANWGSLGFLESIANAMYCIAHVLTILHQKRSVSRT